MPTKTMLRATELGASLERAPGLHGERPEPEGVWSWRDWMTSDWDDAGQLHYLEEWRCRLVRGEGRVARPGVVEVDGQELPYDRLVLATGSRPAIPPIDGLDSVEYWTNREATRTHKVPRSLVVMGGGPVGAELAQFFSRMGSQVTVVERGDHLLGRVHADAGELMAEFFRAEGIDLRLGVGLVSARVPLGSLPRLSTYERPKREGFVRVFADPRQRVLVGAVCVGPQAAEWLGQFTLAIRAEVKVETLLDTIQPYPTFSEGVFYALQELQGELS